jgi:hypothetical protein
MDQSALPSHQCKSCSNVFLGNYCNHCGEKVIEPKERKLRAVISNVLMATSIVDNKFLKSLWLTVSRPGFLSREYADGRRVMYMRPLQMFFILNLIYFLFPVLQMFNSSLNTQRKFLPHSKIARALVDEKIKAEGLNLLGFELMYNEKTTSLAKLLIVVFVIIASIPLSLIFWKRNRYYADHIALSVELTSFNLAVNAIGLSAIFWIINEVFHWGKVSWGSYLNDVTLTVIFVITNLYFLFRASRIFYNQKGKRLVVKVALGIVGLFLALEVFRFILFFITMMTL